MPSSLISILRVLALRGLGVVASLLTVIGIAFHFGAGPLSDAYFLVRRFFGSLTSIVEGVLTSILVPDFVQAFKGMDMQTYLDELRHRERIFFAVGAGLGLLVYLFAPQIVSALAPGLTPETVSIAALFFSMMALTLPVTLSTVFVGTALAAVRHFSAPVAIRLAPRVLILVAVMLVPLGFGMPMIVAAAIFGNLLMLPFVWLVRRRILRSVKQQVGTQQIVQSIAPKRQTSQRAGALGVLSAYFIAVTISESYVASFVGAGAIAILGIGQRISTLGISEMLSSLLSVFYTNFSERAHEPADLNAEISHALRTGFFFFAPLVALLVVLSQPITQLILANGSFSDLAAQQAGYLVAFFAMAALANTFTSILEVAILSAPLEGKVKFFMRSCCIALIVRFVFMAAFVSTIGLKAIGVAALLGPLVMVGMSLRYLRSYTGPVLQRDLLWDLAKVAALTALTAMVCIGIIWLWPNDAGKLGQAFELATAFLASAVTYVCIGSAVGQDEARGLMSQITKGRKKT